MAEVTADETHNSIQTHPRHRARFEDGATAGAGGIGSAIDRVRESCPKIESHYRWRGKLERSAEVLMVMKTTQPRVVALEKLIVAKHPYETPEFVVLNLTGGAKKYLAWLAESCHAATD